MLRVKASERKRSCGEKGSVLWKTVALEACSCVEAHERKRNCGEIELSVWKQSLSRHARVFEASERRRDSVGSAGRDAEPERAESAFLAEREAACTSIRRSTLMRR